MMSDGSAPVNAVGIKLRTSDGMKLASRLGIVVGHLRCVTAHSVSILIQYMEEEKKGTAYT